MFFSVSKCTARSKYSFQTLDLEWISFGSCKVCKFLNPVILFCIWFYSNKFSLFLIVFFQNFFKGNCYFRILATRFFTYCSTGVSSGEKNAIKLSKSKGSKGVNNVRFPDVQKMTQK